VAIGKDDVQTFASFDWTDPVRVQKLLSDSRAFARSAQNMGGR
jgi:hypothetical protein